MSCNVSACPATSGQGVSAVSTERERPRTDAQDVLQLRQHNEHSCALSEAAEYGCGQKVLDDETDLENSRSNEDDTSLEGEHHCSES